jgi:hypothetical protein
VDQNDSGIPTPPQTGDWFGSVLCAADFNGDTETDLAISAGYGTVDGLYDAGYVTVVSGSDEGLSTEFAQEFSQGSAGISGTPEANDDFGGALAAVQVTDVNRFDLAVSSPYEKIGTGPDGAGMIQLLPSAPDGLTGANSEQWYEGTPGVKGTGCANCWFGLALGGPTSSEQI